MTSYDEIYKRFLSKITDYNITEFDPQDAYDMFHTWLMSSITTQKKLEHDLDYDDELFSFAEDLSHIEKECLALGMVIEWLQPQVNSVTNTLQMFGGKEEKFYSQANHLSELQSLLKSVMIQRRKLISGYVYQNNSYIKGS